MDYENKCTEIDKLKAELDKYRPLSKDALKQIQEYYKTFINFISEMVYESQKEYLKIVKRLAN